MSIYRIKGASGTVINQTTTLGERTVIGTSQDCDVTIDAPDASGQLAEIVRTDDGLVLRALAGHAVVRLNGESVTEQALGSGDEIRIAQCRWVLQAPGLKPERVLHGQSTRKSVGWWPWVAAAVALSAAGAAAWAWKQGLLVL